MTPCHHLGTEARHFATTFQTPQDSETESQGQRTHTYSVGGSSSCSRYSKGEANCSGPASSSRPVPKAGADAASLYGKKHQRVTTSKAPDTAAGASALTLSRNAQVRVWLTEHLPGMCQGLDSRPCTSHTEPTLNSKNFRDQLPNSSFLSVKGHPAHGTGFQES